MSHNPQRQTATNHHEQVTTTPHNHTTTPWTATHIHQPSNGTPPHGNECSRTKPTTHEQRGMPTNRNDRPPTKMTAHETTTCKWRQMPRKDSQHPWMDMGDDELQWVSSCSHQKRHQIPGPLGEVQPPPLWDLGAQVSSDKHTTFWPRWVIRAHCLSPSLHH